MTKTRLGVILSVAFTLLLLTQIAVATNTGTTTQIDINNQQQQQQQQQQQCESSDFGSCSSSSSARKYTATQFINFNINTIGGLASAGECEGLSVDPDTGNCYIGNQESLEDDFEHRLGIIKIVLDRLLFDLISDHAFVDNRKDVLKIFMVPEFFMRGPYGAYSTKHVLEDGLINEYATRLKEYISNEVFSDVLFVFGTVLAVELRDGSSSSSKYSATGNKEPDKDTPVHELKAKDLNYYNFSPVFKGGLGHNHYYTVTKHHIAMDDFLDRTILPDPAAITFGTYTRMDERFRNKFNSTIVEDNIIEIDGVRVGIEICLDHREGSLWSSLKKRGEIDQLVDVQLITSGGMKIERGLNVIAPGGVIYLSDGVASSAACRRPHTDLGPIQPDKLCRDVGKNGMKRLHPQGGDGYSYFFPPSHCVDYPKPELLEGYYTLNQPQGCANTLAEYGLHVLPKESKNGRRTLPSIEFYPTVALPGKEEMK